MNGKHTSLIEEMLRNLDKHTLDDLVRGVLGSSFQNGRPAANTFADLSREHLWTDENPLVEINPGCVGEQTWEEVFNDVTRCPHCGHIERDRMPAGDYRMICVLCGAAFVMRVADGAATRYAVVRILPDDGTL